jgi:hypothetical protein
VTAGMPAAAILLFFYREEALSMWCSAAAHVVVLLAAEPWVRATAPSRSHDALPRLHFMFLVCALDRLHVKLVSFGLM